MKLAHQNTSLGFSLFLILTFFPFTNTFADLLNFCDRLPRPSFNTLTKHKTSTAWFEVYEVEPGVWAIYEPFQWQEVISYLITGSNSALLTE